MSLTRARYLPELAMTAHVPPPVVDELTVADFAVLILGLDARHAALAKES